MNAPPREGVETHLEHRLVLILRSWCLAGLVVDDADSPIRGLIDSIDIATNIEGRSERSLESELSSMWLKTNWILYREVRGDEIGSTTDSIDHCCRSRDVLLLKFDPGGLEQLMRSIGRSIDGRKVEEIL